MSEFEQARRDYRMLATQLAYQGFERPIEPSEQQRLDALSDRVVELGAPDFLEIGRQLDAVM